jgi:hypothetical protein
MNVVIHKVCIVLKIVIYIISETVSVERSSFNKGKLVIDCSD